MVRRIGTAWLLLGGLLLAMPAAAQEEPPEEPPNGTEGEAREAFEQGRDAFHDGRFEYALERFRFSLELSGRPELLYNVGQTLERMQRPEEALVALRRYLELVPDSYVRGNVEGRIGALERAVAERRALEAQVAEARADSEARAESEAQTAAADSRPEPAEPEESVVEQWWFWTIIGAVVVGAGVGVVLGVTLGAGSTQDPIPGDEGVVVTTLLEW